MLKRFQIENFGPFLNKETIDLTATRVTENKDTLIDGKYLPIIGFYGPNGGGKSSILQAISLVKTLTLNPDPNLFNKVFWKYKNSSSDLETINFEIDFVDELGKEWVYSASFNDQGFQYESLKILFLKKRNFKEIIVRNQNGIINFDNKTLEVLDLNPSVESIQKTTSTLFYLEPFLKADSYVKSFYKEFRKILFVESDKELIKVPFNLINTNIKVFMSDELEKILIDNKEIILKVCEAVSFNIVDYEVRKDSISMTKTFVVKKKSWDGSTYWMDIENESTGTNKFISIIANVLNVIKNGTILLIDEIDSSLHTKLVEFIIRQFTNPENNTTRSQLIFSSHDLGIMNSSIFRRDELYLVLKNDSYFSNIMSLYDFGYRKDATFYKLYKDGKFGGDPYVDMSFKIKY